MNESWNTPTQKPTNQGWFQGQSHNDEIIPIYYNGSQFILSNGEPAKTSITAWRKMWPNTNT